MNFMLYFILLPHAKLKSKLCCLCTKSNFPFGLESLAIKLVNKICNLRNYFNNARMRFSFEHNDVELVLGEMHEKLHHTNV